MAQFDLDAPQPEARLAHAFTARQWVLIWEHVENDAAAAWLASCSDNERRELWAYVDNMRALKRAIEAHNMAPGAEG
jgi:hypothetical protein